MIEFETITVKNFFSYGNYPTTIQLNRDSTTLVVGKNGAGKSTILLDGIFFALFGKPYRKVTKGLMVNSLNKGGTIVELIFNTKGSTYKVIRGIKPNLFEIEKDGEKLDNTVKNKDLQNFLEEDILKLNIRTFGQTVVLGSSSYIPFMQLDSSKRREIVDDVLNVAVFTTMSDLAKEDLSITNKELSKLDTSYQIAKNEAKSQKSIIDLIEVNKDEVAKGYQLEIDSLEKLIECTLADIGLELEEIASQNQCFVDVPTSSSVINAQVVAIEEQIRQAEKRSLNIEHMTKCSTCLQEVGATHKDELVKKINEKINDLKTQVNELKKDLPDILSKEDTNNSLTQRIQDLKFSIELKKRDVSNNRAHIAKIKSQLREIEDAGNTKVLVEKDKLKELVKEVRSIKESMDALSKTKAVQELSVKLLKDNGIKASVVKEYIPIFNALINQNLKEYGFDIQFSLDETFNEIIKSRGREDFTYHSFSEGEKEKIDYSIMLALRKIAITKNAAHINVLNLDEILDGSLDQDSRNVTLDILSKDVDKSNIFVISHTESNPGFYDSILFVEKKGDFSTIRLDNSN